eukprot:RCo005372
MLKRCRLALLEVKKNKSKKFQHGVLDKDMPIPPLNKQSMLTQSYRNFKDHLKLEWQKVRPAPELPTVPRSMAFGWDPKEQKFDPAKAWKVPKNYVPFPRAEEVTVEGYKLKRYHKPEHYT